MFVRVEDSAQTGAFEMAWNRATPHAEFDIDSDIPTD
jgi:hypothetical protein